MGLAGFIALNDRLIMDGLGTTVDSALVVFGTTQKTFVKKVETTDDECRKVEFLEDPGTA